MEFLNLNTFAKMIPANKEPESWYVLAKEFFPKYGIKTKNDVAGFMAQASQESGDLTDLFENLNYSAERLVVVFKRYFKTIEFARQYARNPQKIANYVYADANRVNKVGNVKEGDGWRFRGRGIFQLTGRWNYEAFGKDVGLTAEEASAYLETKRGAFESAAWYWKKNNLGRFTLKDDSTGLSRAVNGGDHGLKERNQKYERNKLLLNTSPKVEAPYVKRGDPKSDNVRNVQRKLNLTADGLFGANTEAAVKRWQTATKRTPTGYLTLTEYKDLVG